MYPFCGHSFEWTLSSLVLTSCVFIHTYTLTHLVWMSIPIHSHALLDLQSSSIFFFPRMSARKAARYRRGLPSLNLSSRRRRSWQRQLGNATVTKCISCSHCTGVWNKIHAVFRSLCIFQSCTSSASSKLSQFD